MAITLVVTLSGSAVAGRSLRGMLAVTNTGSNSISVENAVLTELTKMGALFNQPNFLTANVAAGTGQPTITASSTAYFPFSLVVPSPNTPGASPSLTRHHDNVFPSNNSACCINCEVRAYDAVAAETVVGAVKTQFPVITPVAPFPVPQGGAEQFNAGGNAVNWFF